MDELKQIMQELMNEIKGMRKDQKEYQQEMKTIKKENLALKEKVARLENNLDRMEKAQRKLNIAIKGRDFGEQNVTRHVEDFLEKTVGAKIEVIDAHKIRGRNDKLPMLIAKLKNSEEKELVMKNKHKLIGTKVYIDHDLTEKEASTQKKIRDFAKAERLKGQNVKIGYQKININGEWIKWNVETNELQRREENKRNVPKN